MMRRGPGAVFLLGLFIILAILIYLWLHPSGLPSLPPDGETETSRQDLEPFEGLIIDGPFRVHFHAGPPSLSLTAETAISRAFVADLRDGTLRLYLKSGVRAGQMPVIDLAGEDIKSVEVMGAARLEVRSGLSADVRIRAGDAAQVLLAGACGRAILEAEGAATIDARALECRSVAAEAMAGAVVHRP